MSPLAEALGADPAHPDNGDTIMTTNTKRGRPVGARIPAPAALSLRGAQAHVARTLGAHPNTMSNWHRDGVPEDRLADVNAALADWASKPSEMPPAIREQLRQRGAKEHVALVLGISVSTVHVWSSRRATTARIAQVREALASFVPARGQSARVKQARVKLPCTGEGGVTARALADAAGISEITAFRWLNEGVPCGRYGEALAAWHSAAQDRIAAYEKALVRLREAVSSGAP